MNNKVLCLCFSSNLAEGLVFPSEEEDCYFPGCFVIEEQAEKLLDQYLFEAIAKNQLVILPLQKQPGQHQSQIFSTHSSAGDFFFVARRTRERYVGKHPGLQHHHPFWRLEALHPNRLEEACQKENFYFVGTGEKEF